MDSSTQIKEKKNNHHNSERILSWFGWVDVYVCWSTCNKVLPWSLEVFFEENIIALPSVLKVSVFMAVALFFLQLNVFGPVLLHRSNEHISTEFKLAQNIQRGLIRSGYCGRGRLKAEVICHGCFPISLEFLPLLKMKVFPLQGLHLILYDAQHKCPLS